MFSASKIHYEVADRNGGLAYSGVGGKAHYGKLCEDVIPILKLYTLLLDNPPTNWQAKYNISYLEIHLRQTKETNSVHLFL